TTTDINGNYSFEVSKKDSLVFEANGYENKKLSINDIVINPNVVLYRRPYDIQEVNVIGQKTKKAIIGTEKRPMLTFSKMFDKNVPTIEQGQIFDIYDWTKINSYNFYIIPSSKFKEITLK